MLRLWVFVCCVVFVRSIASGAALDVWQKVPTPDTNTFNFTGLAFGNERHVMIKGRGRVYLSQDGLNWTNTTPTNFGPTAVDFVNNHFLVTGVSRIWTSADGAIWQQRDVAPVPTVNLEGSTFGNGTYVIAGRTNLPTGGYRPLLLSSPDLQNWSAWLGESGTFRDTAFGNGTFVAVGSNPGHQALFFTSTDGVNWSPQTVPFSNIVYSVIYGGDRFVALGSAACLTSLDGTNWTIHPYPSGNLFHSELAYGNDTFVGVGSFGQTAHTVSYSYDGGVTWKTNGLPGFGSLEGASYANGRFYVCGGTNIWRSEHVSVPALSIPQISGTNLHLSLFGEIGRTYRLQSSPNLIDWVDHSLVTNTMPNHPVELPFSEIPAGFFRALIP